MNDASKPPHATKRPVFHRDRAEYWAFVAQIISAVSVVVSLIFVGLQLRESNTVATRDESNATMTQWSSFRQSIYRDRGTAELFEAGMSGRRELDPADRLRFLYIMREHGWATFQIWDRAMNGLVAPANFYQGAAPDFLRVICTPGGAGAWAEIKRELPQPYVAEMDRQAATYARAHRVRCTP